MPDGRKPGPGGWNRIHLIVDDIVAEMQPLRAAEVPFRSDIIIGPGGRQIVLDDPSGNPIELSTPAASGVSDLSPVSLESCVTTGDNCHGGYRNPEHGYQLDRR